VRVPTLIVHGDTDKPLPFETAHRGTQGFGCRAVYVLLQALANSAA
jgi:hypothetical protein